MEQEREGSRRDGAPRKHFGQRKQTHDERLHQILGAATELIGQYGFYGTSLHQIADAVGMTNAGVLHYVRNKNELMTMVLESSYDEGNPVWMFLRDRLALQTAASISSTHIPVLYRRTVEVNETRPDMVRLFSVLGAEALQPDHPAHDYFQRREKAFWERFRNIAWKVPPGTDMRNVFTTANSAMDGIQLRWLRDDSVSLSLLWSRCEDVIFPSPLWDDYR